MRNPVLKLPGLSGKDDGSVGAIRTGVEVDPCVKGLQVALLVHSNPEVTEGTVPHARCEHLFFAGVDDFDRPPESLRKQGSDMLVMELLPGPEASAHGGFDDPDPVLRKIEQLRQKPSILKGSLGIAPDCQCAICGIVADAAHRFHGHMLDVRGTILTLEYIFRFPNPFSTSPFRASIRLKMLVWETSG